MAMTLGAMAANAEAPTAEQLAGSYPATTVSTADAMGLLDYDDWDAVEEALETTYWYDTKWTNAFTMELTVGEDGAVTLKNWFPLDYNGEAFPDLEGTYDAATGKLTLKPVEWEDNYEYDDEEYTDIYTICKSDPKETGYHNMPYGDIIMTATIADDVVTIKSEDIAFVDDVYCYEYLFGFNPRYVKTADAAVEMIGSDSVAPVYYNLQGISVENPTNGVFIMRVGNKVTKVVR